MRINWGEERAQEEERGGEVFSGCCSSRTVNELVVTSDTDKASPGATICVGKLRSMQLHVIIPCVRALVE